MALLGYNPNINLWTETFWCRNEDKSRLSGCIFAVAISKNAVFPLCILLDGEVDPNPRSCLPAKASKLFELSASNCLQLISDIEFRQ